MRYFFAPFYALTFLFRNRTLWRYVAAPLLITIVVYALSLGFLMRWVNDLLANFLGATGVWAVVVFVFVTAGFMALSLYGFVLFLNIISGPFNEALAQKVLETKSSKNTLSFFKQYGRTITSEVARLLVFGVLSFIVFVLSWVVSAGALFSVFAGALAIFFLVFEFLDYAMAEERWRFRDKIRFMVAHARALACFGIGLAVFLAIPFLNIFFVPAAVIAGARVFLQLNPR